MSNVSNILLTETKLLTFRLSHQQFQGLGGKHFLFGLLSTWIVGMGRYWDDSGAVLAQHLGIGSVFYIFVLSMLLWVVVLPVGPKKWSLTKVVTFVSLTSPPAILYAIPVERFLSMEAARSVNAWFLALVAAWRVALLVFFLRRYAQLGAFRIIVVSLLPLTLIVTTLTALNLERAVFDIMGGFRDQAGTASDSAYAVLVAITFVSIVLFVPLSLCYIGLILNRFIERKAVQSTK
jgi:hypothetical protein